MKEKISLILIMVTIIIVGCYMVTINNHHNKISTFKEMFTEPVYAALACITNSVVYRDDTSGCLLSFQVNGPMNGCWSQAGDHTWYGSCLFVPDCSDNSGCIYTAVLKPGCCGPVVVATASARCSDGTHHSCALVVPSGANSATFVIKRRCPPCFLSSCVISVQPCNNSNQ